MLIGTGVGMTYGPPTFDPTKGGIGDAFALATIAHQGQQYGDRPYIEHPIAVARLLAMTFGPYEHLVVPALLHDVVEDTEFPLYMIGRMFGEVTERAVDAVSRREGETYADLIDRACADRTSLLVKLADNTHNLSTLPHDDRRVRRYIKARHTLLTAYGDDDPWRGLIVRHAHLMEMP